MLAQSTIPVPGGGRQDHPDARAPVNQHVASSVASLLAVGLGGYGVAMTTPAARLAASEFLLLTTYRRDGRPVPTAVFVVPLDAGLGVWTIDGSAKVRRIRADARVTLAECDRVGTPLTADLIEGQARLLDGDGTLRIEAAIQHKYNLNAEQLKGIVRRIGGDREADGIAIDVS